MSDIWSEDQEVKQSPVAIAAKRYQEIDYEIKKLKAEQDSIENQLVGLFPHGTDDFGNHELRIDGVHLAIEIPERFDWDTKILETIFATSDALPDYVKKRLTVDKRSYAKLPEEQQRILLPALTRKPGAAKLTVVNV